MPSMMLLGGVALALLVLDAAADARAAQPTPSAAHPPERSERASRRKPRIVHLPSPAQESSAQRDRRLERECRGLPNAGACLGYAGTHPRAAARR